MWHFYDKLVNRLPLCFRHSNRIFLSNGKHPRAFKINHNNENWNVLPYSMTKMPVSTLIEKKVIFSHAYRGSSRSLHCVTTHVKPPGFKQLNWRIRENLSQAINNGSWYKLSLLVSEDAMIVPATCIYSVWRFTQNSWDMSPWNKHHYFRFYKLGVGKVINRLFLSCTPLTTVQSKIFRYFVSVTRPVLRRFLVFP